MKTSKTKSFILILCLGFLHTLEAQTINWFLVETDHTDYQQTRAFIQSQENEDRLFSLAYSPKFLVYGSRSEAPLEYPSVVRQMKVEEVALSNAIPQALKSFFVRLIQGENEAEEHRPPSQEETCSQTSLLEKDREEFTYNNRWNTERMAGIMTCNVLFIESNGEEDPNYFSWTAKALLKEKMTILKALHTWAYTAFLEGVDVTFVPQWFDRSPELGQGLEPNLHFGSFNTYSSQIWKMNSQIISQLGFTQESFAADEFNFFQKRETAADGAFTIGVHYNHEGRGFIRAHAHIGGPMTFLSSDAPFSLYGHEIGHIFHAFDEYTNPNCQTTSSASFNGIRNLNNIGNGCIGKETCVMVNNVTRGEGPTTHYALCEFTKAHLGWAGDIPGQPMILYPPPDTTFEFYLQGFTFYFPSSSEEKRSAIIKIWNNDQEVPRLVYSETIQLESDSLVWWNEAIHKAGNYTLLVRHGQTSRYALVDSEPVNFSLSAHPEIPFADTCIWFCNTLEVLNLGVENVQWYASPKLDSLLHSGSGFLPETEGVYYMVKEEEGLKKDVARVQVSSNTPATAQLFQTFPMDGPIHLYLQSITGLPHVRAYHWYRNDTLITSNSLPFLDVEQEGEYQVVIDNGCESMTNTLNVLRPPSVEFIQDCENGSYLILSNRPIGIQNGTTQEFTVTDSLWISVGNEFLGINIYSPDQSIFWWTYELVPLSQESFLVENLDGFLRFKTEEGQIISWYRNDTLLLEGFQNWLTVDRPGTYWATLKHPWESCPSISQSIEFSELVLPPVIEKNNYALCLLENSEPPVLEVEGQNIRWYLEPQKEEQVAEGNTFQPSADLFGFNAQLHITQTINGIESPPIRVGLFGQKPLQASLDTFDQQFLAIINGIQPNLQPADYLYNWFFEESFLANTDLPTYPVGDPGTYSVTISNQDPACLITEPFLLEGMVSSVEETFIKEKIRVYPIPARHELTIQMENSNIRSVRIFNLAGQLVKDQMGQLQTKVNLSLNGLLPGYYVAILQTESGSNRVIKFIAQ